MKLRPSELLLLTPRLADHMWRPDPDWADVFDAAGGPLRMELGVSANLWADACRTIGRECAAVALAIVSTKPNAHFARGPAAYFAAMVKRGKTGELNLDRGIWKLRRDRMDRIEHEGVLKAESPKDPPPAKLGLPASGNWIRPSEP